MSNEFFAALVSAGIFHEDEANTTRRVVIDAQGGEGVKIYVERAGDERLLNVTLSLDGIEIHHG